MDFRIANHNEKMKQTKKQTKRNNRNIFGLFVFWKVETKTRTTKERKLIKARKCNKWQKCANPEQQENIDFSENVM